MAARLIARLAAAHLKGRRRATLVSVASVATGVGFSIAMAALMEGSERDFVSRIIDTSPHIVMKDEYRTPPRQPVESLFGHGAVALEGMKPKEELRGIRNANGRIAELDAIPGLAVAPTLRGQVLLRYGGKDMAATLSGIDPVRERRVSNLEKDMVAGRVESLYGAANAIILGAGLADKLSARPGDVLSVSAPSGTLMKMTVVGLFRTGVVAIDDAQGYALLKKVQVLENRANVVNEIRMRLADVTRASAVAHRIEARFGYRTESWEEANEGILEVFVIRNLIMYAVVGAILVVAGFGIFNVVSTITYEKARDIAILKSLGFPARDVRRVFLLEGLALGALGSLLGWTFGFALCQALGTIVIKTPFMAEAAQLPLYYAPKHYAIASAFALGSAALAGYLPARKAARLNPVDIIRGAA
jgi:lipoprotein-releasing system permease protein